MAGTLRSTTNCSLRKLRRARVRDFRFFEASNAARWKGVARWKLSIPVVVVWAYIRKVLPHVVLNHLCCHECLDQVCGVGIPREPFAKSRTGETRQKEADREPGGTTGGYTSTFGFMPLIAKQIPIMRTLLNAAARSSLRLD
jgi:hypothetical protein